MNTFSKSLLLLIIGVCFLSCGTVVETVQPHNNKTYRVDYLFEHDGCKVYRFLDHGNYVYFTNCNGDVTSIESDSTRTVTITRNMDLE